MLTQMPAFISVNRSERLPTSAGEQLRQPERVEGRPPVPQWVASQVRPDLERAPQRLQATFGKAILCKVRSSSSHMPIPILDFRMKTTLNIDDRVMAELKREAARQGRTMSELVETALRLLLALDESGEGSLPFQSSAAAEHSSTLPTAMPCTTPWRVASARRRYQCAGLRRRCGLAISYRLPRLARATTGVSGCLVHYLGDPQ
jgi:Ribbon-helix-helix protein, copG family